jgi:heavy metal sensor kinase
MDFVHSIKFRFTVWYLTILALLLLGLSVGVYIYLSRNLYSNLDNSLVMRTGQVQDVRGVLESMSQGSFEEKVGEVVLFFYERDGGIYTLSKRGVNVSLDEGVVKESIQGRRGFQTVNVEAVGTMRFYVVPFRAERPVMMPFGQGGMMSGFNVQSTALAVGLPTKDIEQALNGLVRTLLIAVPLTLIVAGAGGVFLARRALKPVEQMTNAAQNIGETDLSQRIAVTTRDELGRLATTLNQMIERLEKAFKRQREFTGDASHELRTPLSVIKAESTLALRRVRPPEDYQATIRTIAEEAEHMSRIMDQLLVLARADSGTEQITIEETELNGLLREVVTDIELLSRDKGLELKLLLNEPLIVKGDRGLLRRLFINLLDNAIRYTSKGGSVSVSTTMQERMALVSISDTGIGIPPEHLPRIFDRFYRADKARSRSEGGSGLGLAICKHIVEVHGGRIEVESREGQGSTFKVLIPLL